MARCSPNWAISRLASNDHHNHQGMNPLLQSPLLSPAPIENAVRPTASRAPLMAFVADRRTEASLRTGLSQLSWPQAIIIKRGGIERAIQHLGMERSPETIIIDISGTAMPATRVHELADICEPGVTVIAIGDRNDIGLYRDLKEAGVSEYIFKPATPELLAKALSPQPAGAGRSGAISQKLGKMVALVGARGGVGTTVLAINLARYLAD